MRFYDFKRGAHDFYRCAACGHIFTQEYERVKLRRMAETDDKNMWIHCRSLKYKAAWPFLWEWLYPSILIYTIKLVLARAVYPWAERRAPRLLPYIERLVSNEVTRELPAVGE